jgi:hypothetical protein
MFLKRTLLLALAAALVATAVGCSHHKCCYSGATSYAPPPLRDPCCPP